MTENVSKLKSVQYLVICRAGLAVCAEAEAASEDLRRDMLREFELGVKNFTMPIELKHFDDWEHFKVEVGSVPVNVGAWNDATNCLTPERSNLKLNTKELADKRGIQISSFVKLNWRIHSSSWNRPQIRVAEETFAFINADPRYIWRIVESSLVASAVLLIFLMSFTVSQHL